MKLYQTRPGVAPALGYDPSPRLLESLALPLRYAGCKSSLMTYLGQTIAQVKIKNNVHYHHMDLYSIDGNYCFSYLETHNIGGYYYKLIDSKF